MDKPRLRHPSWAMPWRARAAARDERAVLDLLIKADRGQLPWQATAIAGAFQVRSGTVSMWVIDRARGGAPGAVRLRFSPWGASFTTTISQAPGREALNAGTRCALPRRLRPCTKDRATQGPGIVA